MERSDGIEAGRPDAEKPVVDEAEKTSEPQPYTIFTPIQRSLLLYACSISAVFSTVSSFIYFPAITAIARSLNVSIQAVNFTVTSYQIVSGIAPTIFANLADEAVSVKLINPFKGLKTLKEKANFIIILVGGITYTVFGCLATSLSSKAIQIYSLNYLTAGLAYLPSGLGGMLAALLTGKLLDYEYRLTAHKLNISAASTSVTDFPIEKARLRSIFPMIAISSIATIGYGWILRAEAHLAILLMLQFFSGAAQVFVFVTCGTLLTDLNPNKSSTVQASYNLIRCALSAGGIASVDILMRAIGPGWAFTFYALFGAICVPLLYILKKKGAKWRSRRIVTVQEVEKEKEKEKEKENKN
ncbi:hypothetical protein N0V90_001588 [Kalmusia sp. IMI 367209]|nr:hypothetical protein N0V90_001588 [Kalmusia sp. IMI 367209]